MASPYQSLSYPKFHTELATADTYCGPDCAGCGCCTMPLCCIEPACCSRIGACPCFCTTSTAAFSVALSGLWIAFAVFLVAMSLPDLFTYDVYHTGTSVQLGMWRACGYNLGGYWGWSCVEYGSGVDIDDAWFGLGDTFNAMRALTAISATATLVAGILCAVRLAALQRSKTVSTALSWSLIMTALTALGTATAAFALTMRLHDGFPSYQDWTYGTQYADRGAAWAVLTTAWLMLVIAVPLHLVAHFHHQRSATQEPAMNASLYPVAATPAFSHPQPHYFAHVQHSAAVTQPSAYQYAR